MINFFSSFYQLRSFQTVCAVILFIGMGAAVLVALGFQYGVGLVPCKLCLMERVPYYAGIPLAIMATVLSVAHVHGLLIRGLFVGILFLMVYGLLLSAYHVGVESGFWAGPADCEPGISFLPERAVDLLKNLNTIRPVSCSVAAGYFLGLSMSGWNVVATLGYSLIAGLASCAGRKTF